MDALAIEFAELASRHGFATAPTRKSKLHADCWAFQLASTTGWNVT